MILRLSSLLLFFLCYQASAQISKMPFEFNGSHIYIKVLTGKSDTLLFIFDTGATGASIDSAKAEEAGVSKNDREIIGVTGHGGAQNYIMAKNQSFRVAGLNITGVNPILINFDDFKTETGMKIDGLLGYELLNRFITQIDFDRKEMLFYNNITDANTKGYTTIPFEFKSMVNWKVE